MEKVLLAFIGNNDTITEEKKGPILDIISEIDFKKAYILYNSEKYIPNLSAIKNYCKEYHKNTQIFFECCESIDPTNYDVIYPALYRSVNKIQKKENNAEFYVLVSSGTPTMHTCWVLLKQSGFLYAHLIQTAYKKGYSEITFSLNDFPEIEDSNELKAKATQLNKENENLKKQLLIGFENIIGQSKSIELVKQKILPFAKENISIFIHGESGTGKELFAKAIHNVSKRSNKAYYVVNCSTIVPSLAESELFGHVKGAFTDAKDNKKGLFELANGGTLFLDEIGDLPLTIQAKLLRVLEEKKIRPLGSEKEINVDVRIISATNKDIDELIKNNLFRKDLKERICEKKIILPPLRERENDVLLIAEKFLHEFNHKYNKYRKFDISAKEKLLHLRLEGNVRELCNLIRNAVLSSENDIISAKDIETDEEIITNNIFNIPDSGIDLYNDFIPELFRSLLKRHKNNATTVADLLKIKPHTFRKKLKSLNIEYNKN